MRGVLLRRIGPFLLLLLHSASVLAAPPTSEPTLDRIQHSAFDYLWEQRDTRTGFVYNTTELHAPASPTALGVALSSIPVGIERGWITRQQGYERAKQLLQALARTDGTHGFFYHFLDAKSGKRAWHSEVSCIDSAIAFAGAMVIATYFRETEVEQLAQRLIDRAVWPWFLDEEDTLKWAWRPEAGFEGGPMQFSESILAYLLALGSATHPIPSRCWDAMKRPISRVDAQHPRMLYTGDGALFAYLLPLAWFDLRGLHDAYADYWSNARTALLANIQFCQRHAQRFRTYQEGFWGVSAALGPDGYKAYGAEPAGRALHDGTVAPHVVAAAMPWLPDVALQTYVRMGQRMPALSIRYGLGDSLNLDRDYACPHTIALDQGLALLMIENARTGLIWRLFMQHPVAQRALVSAGFVPGALEEPLTPPVVAGHPGATLRVPVIDHAVAIDGNISEWIRQDAFELTPTRRRNVEFGYVKDAKDASVMAYAGRTREHLYLAGVILDDAWVATHQGRESYHDDCLELFWDLDGDGFRFDGNPYDVQLGLALRPKGPASIWAWGALKRAAPEVDVALHIVADRATFELRVPLTMLPGVADQGRARFSLAYHDRDPDGKTAKLHWSIDADSTPGTLLFGPLVLEHPAAAAPDPAAP